MRIYNPRPAEGCQWLILGDVILELEDGLRSATPVGPTLDVPLPLERLTVDDRGNPLIAVPMPWVTSLAPCVVRARRDELLGALGPAAVELWTASPMTESRSPSSMLSRSGR